MLTRIFDGQFIEIDLNNNQVLNYFDTCGAPLNASQMDFVANFLTCMCGRANDDEIIQDRTEIISHYVTRIYDAVWQEWWNKNTALRSDIARKAMTMEWMLPRQPSGRNTLLDYFTDFSETMSKDITELHPEELLIFNYFHSISNEKITEYIVENSAVLRDVSYAYMKLPYS